MKVLIVLFATVFTISCKTEKKVCEKCFFDYDRVEYYYKNISENDLNKIHSDAKGKSRNSNEIVYMELVGHNYPHTVKQDFDKTLKKFGYVEKEIESSKFNELDEVFSEKKCDSPFAYACGAIYRDIILFYKNDSLVGIAKICFGCRQYRIFGTKKNDEDFGQCEGYEKLQEILNN